MKTCSKCGFEGDDLLFKKGRNTCKNCVSAEHIKYSEKNKDKIRARNLKYRQNNKKQIILCKRRFRENNKESISVAAKKYRQSNQDKLILYWKQYRQTHKENRNNYNNAYQKKRIIVDPTYKMRRNFSISICHALNGRKDGKSILKYLPYSFHELKIHLENQFDDKMNWENYGKYWHIDHIIPQSKLPYTSMEDENFKKCWALNNLRPLEATANFKKGAK